METPLAQPPRWAGALAVGLAVVFALLAILYSLVTPLWEAPDEVGHFDYVAHLLTERSLPRQRIGELGEAHQPPLYYALAALAASPADLSDTTGGFRLNPRFVWAGRGGKDVNISLHGTAETFPYRGEALGLRLARLASVLMAAVTVLLTVALGWRLFPERPLVGLLAGCLTAFNPQFLFISSAVNNDNLLAATATGAWWQVSRALDRPAGWRPWSYVGLWVGAAMLAKTSGVMVAVGVGVALVVLGWRRRSAQLALRAGLAVALPALLLTAPWFIRNQLVYGDPVGWSMYQQLGYGDVQPAAFGWNEATQFLSVQFRSFWGVFGWMNVPAPGWFYGLVLALVVVGLGGFVWQAVRGDGGHQTLEGSGYLWKPKGLRASPDSKAATGSLSAVAGDRRDGPGPDHTLALLLLAALALSFQAMLTAIVTRCDPSCYQGRYLFPVIGPLMLLLSYGLLGWFRRVSGLWAGGLSLALVGLAVYTPFAVIRPAYEVVPLPRWHAWLIPHRTDVAVADLADLRGYRVERGETHVTLTLYWQARRTADQDYYVSAHLLDAADEVVAKADHIPGRGAGYPPRRWQPEDLVADEHRLDLPPDLRPGRYRFRVGMYHRPTRQRLPLFAGDTPLGEHLILDQPLHR